jgi:hypothetical protein
MNKNLLLLVSGMVMLAGCSRAPRPLAVTPVCAAASDSLTKYVSKDALPFAQIVGTPRVPAVPPGLRRGDSVAVEFVVQPSGLADPTSVEIAGSTNPAFTRDVLRFVTESRFTPATLSGCNVVSKYNLVIKPAA